MPAEPFLVLVVDDSPDNREMYVQYLEMSGHRVIEAVDGREAVERARSEAPDVIVMDLSLPVMSGWEAVACLKSDARTAATPVVALSGHIISPSEAHDAGFAAVLEKPCAPEELARIVEELITASRSRTARG